MKIPSTLVQLGVVEKIIVEKNDVTYFYEWPTKGKHRRVLFTNKSGDKLYILVVRPHPITQRRVDKQLKEINACAEKYEKWSRRESEKINCFSVPDKPVKKYGRAKSIVYLSDKFDGEMDTWIHDFGKCVSVSFNDDDDPTVATIAGGKLRITKYGIEG